MHLEHLPKFSSAYPPKLDRILRQRMASAEAESVVMVVMQAMREHVVSTFTTTHWPSLCYPGELIVIIHPR